MNRDGDWMCGTCQHMNFRRRDACQQCTRHRFGGDAAADMASYGMTMMTATKPGDWYCTSINCGAHNFASRTNCYMCGGFKDEYCYGPAAGIMAAAAFHDGSGLPGWKSGDWLCKRFGCGWHNYASRMECYKCKTARDYGAM
ncbi:zinc finger Ran-binding domain-containing protein 2-like [Impatiens glandulifera]|uniref:zinc finger Ran-binding domain-containing protein 2-like n=1 Tax=Impatiens glandulifera TaxID=253017 RepID=UPI001FB0EF82|nr:zinc finger Ran-binding domain-containing protein 2-like [Impatiens glandulifera]